MLLPPPDAGGGPAPLLTRQAPAPPGGVQGQPRAPLQAWGSCQEGWVSREWASQRAALRGWDDLSAGGSPGSPSPGAKTTRTSPPDENPQELVCYSPGGLQGPEATGGFVPCAGTPTVPCSS